MRTGKGFACAFAAVLFIILAMPIAKVINEINHNEPPSCPELVCPEYTGPSVDEIAAAKILLENQMEYELKSSVVFTEEERAKIQEHYVAVTMAMDKLRKKGFTTKEIIGGN